ncbi:hypothetical protein JG687_00013926, partial [Phytophthora cactorum]
RCLHNTCRRSKNRWQDVNRVDRVLCVLGSAWAGAERRVPDKRLQDYNVVQQHAYESSRAPGSGLVWLRVSKVRVHARMQAEVALDGGNAPRERSGIAPVKQHFELRLFELTGVVFKNPCHNHVNTETLCAALKQCKDRLSDSMLSMLDAFGQTNTDTKQIVSYVADTTGLPITTQQVRNLMNARLGHGNAEQRLKAVLTEFASTEDTEGVLLQGDWDQTVGIVLQTKAQREIFSRWGDTLALYWTHNCTDLGFYVAKRGFVGRVEVVQDEELVVKSIAELVIDKDFTEWSTLREAFPQAA